MVLSRKETEALILYPPLNKKGLRLSAGIIRKAFVQTILYPPLNKKGLRQRDGSSLAAVFGNTIPPSKQKRIKTLLPSPGARTK